MLTTSWPSPSREAQTGLRHCSVPEMERKAASWQGCSWASCCCRSRWRKGWCWWHSLWLGRGRSSSSSASSAQRAACQSSPLRAERWGWAPLCCSCSGRRWCGRPGGTRSHWAGTVLACWGFASPGCCCYCCCRRRVPLAGQTGSDHTTRLGPAHKGNRQKQPRKERWAADWCRCRDELGGEITGCVRLRHILQGAWIQESSSPPLCCQHSWEPDQGTDPTESCCLCVGQTFLFMQGWFPSSVHSTAAHTAAPPHRGDKTGSWGQGLNEATVTQHQTTVLSTPVQLDTGLCCNMHCWKQIKNNQTSSEISCFEAQPHQHPKHHTGP